MELELYRTLLEEFLQKIETKSIETIFREFIYRRSETAPAVLLIGFRKELAHVQLFIRAHILRIIWRPTLELHLEIEPLPPALSQGCLRPRRKRELCGIVPGDKRVVQRLQGG
jgi:hypothetical protein